MSNIEHQLLDIQDRSIERLERKVQKIIEAIEDLSCWFKCYIVFCIIAVLGNLTMSLVLNDLRH